MRKTRLMSKLFSEDTPNEYKGKILSKMDEAHENGSATLDEDGEKLQFADVDGDIIVEDQTDGMNEVTRISQNPDNENDYIMSEVEVPTEEEIVGTSNEPTEKVTEETVTESDNLESIEIKRLPGIDGPKADDIVDDLEIEVNTGIVDDEKSGTAVYSMRFKNFSQKKAQLFAKVFSECSDCFDKVVESANVDEDVQVKFEGDQMKIMSITFGTPNRTFSVPEEEQETADLTEVIDAANKLVDLTEGGITKENADEVKTLAEEVIGKAEAVENDEVSLKSIKSMCSKFSEEAAAVADAEDENFSKKGPWVVVACYNPMSGIEYSTVTKDRFNELKSKDRGKIKHEIVSKEFDTYKEGLEVQNQLTAKKKSKFSEEADVEEVVETPVEETTVEETVTESNANPQVKQCEETGKWFIEEDPEKNLYETQEEANEVAAKMFSDPKVTVTIEDIEPASVSDLLTNGVAPKAEETESLEPTVSPNEGAGRSFSMTGVEGAYNNPLLYTEIH